MLRDVPHRVQLPGSGCGLYSLGMVMDYWHTIDPSNPTALVCDKDGPQQPVGNCSRVIPAASPFGDPVWNQFTLEGSQYLSQGDALAIRNRYPMPWPRAGSGVQQMRWSVAWSISLAVWRMLSPVRQSWRPSTLMKQSM